ncbi:hypothetical protein GGS21DRAFT_357900 [Xylaria nigripes]|nr:hypothetical protein GGS21DRAFT_357900 [Xylaria nigripes]
MNPKLAHSDHPPRKTPDGPRPVATQCLFKCFPSLPPELRHMIWDTYVDSLRDVPELLIHEPSEFPPFENPTTIPKVYTAFPATMHVNHEARVISQSRIHLIKVPAAPCMVPVRPFRPEFDILYIPWEAWRSFFLLREFYYEDEWLTRLQHVAVDICVSTNLAVFFRQVQYLPALRTLRFILASEEGHASDNSMLILPTPVTRCALRPFPTDYGDGATDSVRRISSYLKDVNSRAWDGAQEAVEAALSVENRAAVERLVDNEGRTLKFSISASILMEYRRSRKGFGFVEMSSENVTNLVLRIR